MTKLVTVVLVPISLLFTWSMPAGLQFYFACATATSYLQTSLLFNPSFRKLTGLSTLPPREVEPPRAPGAPPKGRFDDILQPMKSFKETIDNKSVKKDLKSTVTKKLEDDSRMQTEYYASLRERMAEKEKSQKMKRRP